MSKNKRNAEKSGAKKIPKRIAGVKIPKGLRDSGNAAVKLARSPMARELLSAGLAAAAAAVAANTRARKEAQRSGADAAQAFTDVADAATKSASEIKAALIEAAGVAAQQFFSRRSKAPADTATNADADASQSEPIVPPPTDEAQDAAKASGVNGAGPRAPRPRPAKPSSPTL